MDEHDIDVDGLAGYRAVVLVEGESDRAAVRTLARRRGRNLDADAVAVVPMGGATNAGRYLERLARPATDLRLSGLYDVGEERSFRRGLERAGLGSRLNRADMERLGFFVCVDDLEDELIRALGADVVQHVVDAAGDIRSFRTLQRQPAQRHRPVDAQLRRFLGAGSGRKVRYAELLVEALDLDRVPPPLDRVLAIV